MTKHFPIPVRGALALACAVILAGCSLNPHYVRPAAPVAASFPGVAQAATEAHGADIGWRDFFGDARLQRYIELALENNRDLRIAARRIEEARALYGVARADRLPNLALAASETRASVPASVSPTGARVDSERYDVGVSLTAFELDFFGRVRSLNQAALAQYLATREARDSAQIALVAEVARAYLGERAYYEQYALAQQTLAGREEGFRLSQQRFQAGVSSKLDLRLSETLLESARATLATLARQRAQSVNALTLLAGTPLDDVPPLPAKQPAAVAKPGTGYTGPGSAASAPGAAAAPSVIAVSDIPAGLPSDLLARRPDIRAAEQRLLAANANIGAARAAFFPRISLTGSIGSASTDLSGLFESGSRAWSFVPQLTLPIFSAGRNVANLDIAQARKHIAVAEYERTIQAAFREVADALAARAFLDEQVRAQRATLDAQTERMNLVRLRFQSGVASALDVLDAERELFNAQQSLVQAQQLRQINAVDLYRALGGGLEPVSRVADGR